MNKVNILVTGVGAIIGYGIINSLRQQNLYPLKIVGMDIYNDAYGQFLCDKFYVAERADSQHYQVFINKLVAEEQIDLIIPGIEQDMYRLFELKKHINAKVVLNNDLLINLSKDKLGTYCYFRDTNLNVIPTLFQASYEECVERLGTPFLMKPRSSYASKGIHRINSKEEFVFYNKNKDANIYQRIIGSDAEEYTVAVFGKADGTYADHIILKRKLAQTGATDKATLIPHDEEIMRYVDEICMLTKPSGPTNIQLRKEGDKVYLLEINPRISSACSIRTVMGYNEPLKCIEYYLYGRSMPPTEKKVLHAVRFISDYFYE
jgi:carbamoyl-phosphate synthase large subunit